MKKVSLLTIFFYLLIDITGFSQDIQITKPVLEFNGDQLLISYDFIGENKTDLFYVWVEMEKMNGDHIKIEKLSGDVGRNIKSGKNRKIRWIPDNDSVVLNEEVFVRVKAEKYIKAYNKADMILLSAAFPGWGQTRISNGKPWWIAGVASYGALAGGLVAYQIYLKTYADYNSATTAIQRTDLLARSQNQYSTSNILLVSGVALWAVNLIWAAVTPVKFKPLQYIKLSLIQSSSSNIPVPGFAMSLNF
jgi:hypothetical protein